MKVWVVNVRTESYDEYNIVLDQEYDSAKIEEFLKQEFPEEYEYVGFVNWGISQEEVISL